MEISYVFPTKLASVLSRKVDLIQDERKDDYEAHERLQGFQQMALMSPIEDCLLIYTDVELTVEQLKVLGVIHRSTKAEVLGHIVGNVMNQSNVKPTEVAQLIIGRLTKDEGLDDKSIDKILGDLLK